MYVAAKVLGLVGYFVAMNRFSGNPGIAIICISRDLI